MIENVFRASRRVRGKKRRARFFSGRYTLRRGDRPVFVALETTDELVARKRLRDIVVRAQREAEGIVSPAAVRDTAGVPLVNLIADYRLDLVGLDREPGHIRDTIGRITRIVRESSWVFLQDIRPQPFMAWRAACRWSAKTKKEYQTSINAFLNWLVDSDRLLVNPLRKVELVDIRGKAVRKSRSYTFAEIQELYRVSPKNRGLLWLFLTYTGCRKNEARMLRWCDVTLGQKPSVLFREENTKSDVKRPVPLKPELAALLAAEMVQLKVLARAPDGLVFNPFPSDDALHADLAKAGINRKDAVGRVVHFHAFRKTFQTWGATSGVGQRAAQELLGHSDPALTANVYTDVAALALHDEVAKIPWISDAQPDSHGRVRSPVRRGLREILTQLVSMAQTAAHEAEAGVSNWLPDMDSNHSAKEWQNIERQLLKSLRSGRYAQPDSHARAAIAAIRLLAGEQRTADGNRCGQRDARPLPLKGSGRQATAGRGGRTLS